MAADDAKDQIRSLIDLERFSFTVTAAALGFAVYALAHFQIADASLKWVLRIAIVLLTLCLTSLFGMIVNLKAAENHDFLIRITYEHSGWLAKVGEKLGWFAVTWHEGYYVWLRWVAALSAVIGFGALAAFVVVFGLTR